MVEIERWEDLSVSNIRDLAASLVGLEVLAVSSDLASGSLFSIGSWRPRRQRIDNPHLTEDEAANRGSHTIFVQCAWELDSPKELRDDPTRPFRQGERLLLLNALVGSQITAAAFVDEGHGLIVKVDTGLSLTLEPTRTSSSARYSISADGEYCTVYADGRIEEWTDPIAASLAALTQRWTEQWPECRPIGHELRHCRHDRWVRFHSLPESKRYASTDDEYTELLHRHHTVIDELRASTPGTDELVVVTASWSGSEQSIGRTAEVSAAMPSWPWISVLRETEDDGYENWTHLFVARIGNDETDALEPLLRLVADCQTGDVIITEPGLRWLYHPYDGGADVIASSTEQREGLRAAHPSWLSSHAQGL